MNFAVHEKNTTNVSIILDGKETELTEEEIELIIELRMCNKSQRERIMQLISSIKENKGRIS